MLRSAFIAVLSLVCPVLVQAQKIPDVEVFGGVSYLNARGFYEREHFLNAATGVTLRVNKHFGLAAEGGLPLAGPSETSSSIFRTRDLGLIVTTTSRKTETSTALFGPRFFLPRGKMTLFAHGLAGVIRTTSEYSVTSSARGLPPGGGPLSFPVLPTTFRYSENTFAYGFGGGIDLDLNRRFAIRLMQADYLRARIEPTGNQLRLQSGVVVRFGNGSSH